MLCLWLVPRRENWHHSPTSRRAACGYFLAGLCASQKLNTHSLCECDRPARNRARGRKRTRHATWPHGTRESETVREEEPSHGRTHLASRWGPHGSDAGRERRRPQVDHSVRPRAKATRGEDRRAEGTEDGSETSTTRRDRGKRRRRRRKRRTRHGRGHRREASKDRVRRER